MHTGVSIACVELNLFYNPTCNITILSMSTPIVGD